MALEWKPTKRQEDFLSLPDSIFEALFGGAAGGAKTETLMMLPIVRGFYKHPRFKMLFLRRTYPEIENEVVPRSHDRGFYSGTGGQYNSQFRRWKWPSGAIVQYGHCEHEQDVKKYDTSEYNVICFDELTSFTEYIYNYLTMSRCRSSAPDLPAIIRSGTNPGGIGHTFCRKRFVDPAPGGYTILRERKKYQGVERELTRIFIPSKVEDNDYLMKNDPNYIARLDALSEADRAAKLLGDWYTFSGQVFDDFRTRPFPDEPDTAVHVIEPFDIPSYWPRVLSIDWGYSANTVAGWYAINPAPENSNRPGARRAKIYKYREYVTKKTKITEWAQAVKELTGDENLSVTALDPSAWGNRGDEFTVAQQFMQASNLRPMKADNDRIGGKLLIQEYLRFRPRFTDPIDREPDAYTEMQILRLSGEKARKEYLDSFRERDPEILPKFQIFNSCRETIRVLPTCVYDKNKVEDVAEFEGDDAYDETRYGLKACQLFLDGGIQEHDRTEELSKILAPVQADRPLTQSELTTFYIRMGKFEHKHRETGTLYRRGLRFRRGVR